MGFLLSTSLTQALLASYLLWKDFRRQDPERYLFYLVFLMSIHMGLKFFLREILQDSFMFNHMVTCFAVGYGPPIYFYVKAKLFQKPVPQPTRRIHFALMGVLAIVYVLVGAWYMITQNPAILITYSRIAGMAVLVSGGGYWVYVVWAILKHDSQGVLAWLKVPALLSLLPHIALLGSLFVEVDLSIIRYVGYGEMCFLMLAIMTELLKKKEISSTSPSIEPLQPEAPTESMEEKSKYEKSGLTEARAIAYLEQLEHLMQTEKPYLNASLSLGELATASGINKHHLTETLNRTLGKTFYQYINTYRVQTAQALIKSGSEENLLQLAYAAGFNSKTSFNAYFKKIVGVSPSQYRKTHAPSKHAA
ncbi:helix-turn-helix domain-containing protein [Pontibacter sp. G13]|uniref:helix-turn-helix domain-containing protein n=1 Tax=Pontibacter sp. G13 TaxID=3074898 RepID=UPI00288A1302|nr:helix-turn-helix domain-containing protein [Pontibacter sp. G13]WNJ18464.1 helix-turn-helix domain-containing protein [Pontibacter sp. G13]